LESEQIKAVPEQIKALESRFANHDVLAKLWKDLNLSSVLFGKAFYLHPDCERVSDFAAQQHHLSQRI